MNQQEKIKRLQARLAETEQRIINRQKTYEKGMEMLNAEADSIKARLYDLLYDQKKK